MQMKIIRMCNCLEGGGQQLLFRPADEFAKPPVHREETACDHFGLGHSHRCLLEYGVEPLLALPQRLLSPPSAGDVSHNAAKPYRMTVYVSYEGCRGLNIQCCPIFSNNFM